MRIHGVVAGWFLFLSSSVGAGLPVRPPAVDGWVWQQLAEGGRSEVLVLLADRVDLEAATAGVSDRLARRRAVVDAARAVALRSQADLRAFLAQRHIPHRSFYVANAILVEVDRELVATLAARPDVARIVGNPTVHLAEPSPEAAPSPGEASLLAVTWGVDRINAPTVWGLGVTGEGIVVGGQDTGVRWTHEAIQPHYRGWDGTSASHDYNWHDAVHVNGGPNPCGVDNPEPCDDHGHGTHTVGTATGGTPSEVIGVAPGAKWIACRNMDRGNGTPAQYLECFEFLLAPWPYGGNPTMGDPDLGADVTINSWTCPPSEGCTWDAFETAVAVHRAAGIFTAASAGNSGPNCSTIDDPPPIYAAVFSVGAANSSDRLAGFSSRGPTAVTALMKPEVVAPGVGVRSALKNADDHYDSWSGTSMAGPHVAGAVALLWSAEPTLRGDIDRTEALLESTAWPLTADVETCGGDYATGPNNSWGRGRIDVARALAAIGPTTETSCDDLLDNDGDGYTDCADIDCAGDPACPELGNCSDGIDNDLDTLIDCDDPECELDPVCPGLAIGALQLLTPAGLVPPHAAVFAVGCRAPAWLLCPETVASGPTPGRLVGAAVPLAPPALVLFQHSEVGPTWFVKDGPDVVYSGP